MKRITTTKKTVEEYDEQENLVRREITEEKVEENDTPTTPSYPHTQPYIWWQKPVTWGGHLQKYDPTVYTINTTISNPASESADAALKRAVQNSKSHRD